MDGIYQLSIVFRKKDEPKDRTRVNVHFIPIDFDEKEARKQLLEWYVNNDFKVLRINRTRT